MSGWAVAGHRAVVERRRRRSPKNMIEIVQKE
jgi:hypothetical protein